MNMTDKLAATYARNAKNEIEAAVVDTTSETARMNAGTTAEATAATIDSDPTPATAHVIKSVGTVAKTTVAARGMVQHLPSQRNRRYSLAGGTVDEALHRPMEES
jgi:hypothetical protein